MANCRSCGAPIRWVETERGKLMPVDEHPSAEGTIVLRWQEGRKQLALVNVPPQAFLDEPRYTSHFATCRDADQWRRAS